MLSFHSNYEINSRNSNYTARKLWKTRFRSQDQENDIYAYVDMYVIRESVKGFLYYAYIHIPAIKVSILSTKE